MGRQCNINGSTEKDNIHAVCVYLLSLDYGCNASFSDQVSRYLTKITDQIAVLISNEYSRKLVLVGEVDGTSSFDTFGGFDEEKWDRMFTFEMPKSHELEEKVELREGFTVRDILPSWNFLTYCASQTKHSCIKYESSPEPGPIAEEKPKPSLVVGETRQAVITTKHIPASTSTIPFMETGNTMHLKSLMLVSLYVLHSFKK